MWIARNKDNGLYLYRTFPVRSIADGFWYADTDDDCSELYLPESMFPEVQWEDEPVVVELIIKKQKEKNMTKKELIEALSNTPDDVDVYFYNHADNQYYYIDLAYFDGDKVVLEEKDI